jgi:arylsulfatase A-like enzyme
LRERYAEITAMDRAIGQLRKHLAATGLREDTLLFYCGDNGTSADGSLVRPHRGVKGEVYDGGILVPGLIEWPARIKTPRTTTVRATTSDLLPTLAALTGQPLPQRPIDGTNLMPMLDGKMSERPVPLYFWDYDTSRFSGIQMENYIDPKQQEGTTPLAKLSGGKATRDFRNLRHPGDITEADFRGPRAIIDGHFKLVIRDGKKASKTTAELYDLQTDPAEKTSLTEQQPERVQQLQTKLRTWQESVLKSLTGGDYTK